MVLHQFVCAVLLGALYLLVCLSIFQNFFAYDTFDAESDLQTNLDQITLPPIVTRPRMVASLQQTSSDTPSSKTSGKAGTGSSKSSNPRVSVGLTNDALIKLTKAIKSDADYLTTFVLTMSSKDIKPFSTPPLTRKDMCIPKKQGDLLTLDGSRVMYECVEKAVLRVMPKFTDVTPK